MSHPPIAMPGGHPQHHPHPHSRRLLAVALVTLAVAVAFLVTVVLSNRGSQVTSPGSNEPAAVAVSVTSATPAAPATARATTKPGTPPSPSRGDPAIPNRPEAKLVTRAQIAAALGFDPGPPIIVPPIMAEDGSREAIIPEQAEYGPDGSSHVTVSLSRENKHSSFATLANPEMYNPGILTMIRGIGDKAAVLNDRIGSVTIFVIKHHRLLIVSVISAQGPPDAGKTITLAKQAAAKI